MDRYKVFPSGELGVSPTGNWTPYADAQATVEALQARVRELEQPVYVCQGCGRLGRDGWLPTSFTSDELRGSVQCPDCGCIDREKNTARELAAICTKAQSELAQRTAELDALQRVRDEFERERDQLHAALMEAKAALNIYRATLDAERENVARLERELASYKAGSDGEYGDRIRATLDATSQQLWMPLKHMIECLTTRIDTRRRYEPLQKRRGKC